MADFEKIGMTMLLILFMVNLGLFAIDQSQLNPSVKFNIGETTTDYNSVSNAITGMESTNPDTAEPCANPIECGIQVGSDVLEVFTYGIGFIVSTISFISQNLLMLFFGYAIILEHFANASGDEGVKALCHMFILGFSTLALFGLWGFLKSIRAVMRR